MVWCRVEFWGSVILTLLPMVALASECDDWQTRHPEWLWCDDFESAQPLARRYEDASLDGTGMTLDGTVVFEGQKSLRQRYQKGQVNGGWIAKVRNEGWPEHLYVRWYHYFPKGYSRFPQKMGRVRYRQRSGNWKSIVSVHAWLKPQWGELTADVKALNSSQANRSGWLGVEEAFVFFYEMMGRWVSVEMEVKLNTPGQQDGLYRFWVDDKQVIEALEVDLRGNHPDKLNEVMLDTYWNGGSPKKLDRYFDNFVISTQKIGPYRPELP